MLRPTRFSQFPLTGYADRHTTAAWSLSASAPTRFPPSARTVGSSTAHHNHRAVSRHSLPAPLPGCWTPEGAAGADARRRQAYAYAVFKQSPACSGTGLPASLSSPGAGRCSGSPAGIGMLAPARRPSPLPAHRLPAPLAPAAFHRPGLPGLGNCRAGTRRLAAAAAGPVRANSSLPVPSHQPLCIPGAAVQLVHPFHFNRRRPARLIIPGTSVYLLAPGRPAGLALLHCRAPGNWQARAYGRGVWRAREVRRHAPGSGCRRYGCGVWRRRGSDRDAVDGPATLRRIAGIWCGNGVVCAALSDGVLVIAGC